jgi:hypothetical protein
MSKKWMTLAEHHAQLKAEGRYDAIMERKRLQEEELQKREAELRLAEAPLLQDLLAVGYQADSVWDLVNTAIPYPEALPVLLDHLQRPYPDPVRDGIARALAVRQAKFGWHVLVRLYRAEPEPDGRVKQGLAAAVAAAADDDLLDELIALLRDVQLGPTRVFLLSALTRSKDPRARAALTELATDPDLAKEIQVILRRRKRTKPKPRIH